MSRLPSRFAVGVSAFAPLFLQRSWPYAKVLLAGATLTRANSTVTGIQPITGLDV